MLKLFRTPNPFAIIALFGITICIKLSFLSHPVAVSLPPGQFVWKQLMAALEYVLGSSSFVLTFFAILNIAAQGLYLNRIANTVPLFGQSTYIPALCYVTLSSLAPEWNYLSAFLIGNWFLLGALDGLMRLYARQDVRKILFNTGCWFSIAALLIFSNIFFLLLFFIALSILRPFKMNEWAMALLGVFTPLYFLAGILFLYNRLYLLPNIVTLGLPQYLWEGATLKTYLAFGTVLLLFLFGILYLNRLARRMLIQTKKSWGIIIAALIIGVMVRFFNTFEGFFAWLPVLLPISLIISNIWTDAEHARFPKIAFYLLLLVVLVLQWMPEIS